MKLANIMRLIPSFVLLVFSLSELISAPKLSTSEIRFSSSDSALADSANLSVKNLRQGSVGEWIFNSGGLLQVSSKNKGDRLFYFENFDSLTIDGKGGTLEMDKPYLAFTFYKCKNIKIKNLTLTTKELPFAVGKVIETGDDFFDVEICEPYSIENRDKVEAVMSYDKERGRMCETYDKYLQFFENSIEKLSDKKLRIKFKNSKAPQKGIDVLLRFDVYSFSAIRFSECENVSFENVKLGAIGGMGAQFMNVKNVDLKDFRIEPPAENIAMSTTADATHFNQCYGEINFDNCHFKGMGDDGTNIHHMYLTYIGKKGDFEYEFSFGRKDVFWPEFSPHIGDKVAFGSSENFLLPDKNLRARVLEKKVDNKAKRIYLKLDKNLAPLSGTTLANMSALPKVRIKNSSVKSNRARGFVIKTHDVVIENCLFDSTSAAGILAEVDNNYWFEALPANNVLIKNCTFKSCNFWTRKPHNYAIVADATYGKDSPRKAKVFLDLRQQGNKFIDCQGSIFIKE